MIVLHVEVYHLLFLRYFDTFGFVPIGLFGNLGLSTAYGRYTAKLITTTTVATTTKTTIMSFSKHSLCKCYQTCNFSNYALHFFKSMLCFQKHLQFRNSLNVKIIQMHIFETTSTLTYRTASLH